MPPPPPNPSAVWQRLMCPRCKTLVEVPVGTRPECHACGFPGADRRAASAAPPAAPRPAPAGPPAIEVRGLTKRYGKYVALRDVSFTVPRGGVVGFVGPNGAGKTTTIRILMGLIHATRGAARVLGHPTTDPKKYLGKVGALIETPAFHPQLSGRRNLHALAVLGGHDTTRVASLLQLVGLADRGGDLFRTYSLGMKQRLGIAAALLSDPDLLILDEPTNGLDPAGIREMRGLLRSLGDAGKTVFVSSHLLAEVQRMCDRLIILHQGALVYAGEVDGLLANQVGIIATPDDRRHSLHLLQICRATGYKAEETAGSVLIHAPSSACADINRRAQQAGITLRELRMHAADLEETVLAMTGAGKP